MQSPILIGDVNVNKVIVSNKVAFGKKAFKYFIRYKNDYEKVMPLRIMLPKRSAYRRDFDETKYMSFFIKDTLKEETFAEETFARLKNRDILGINFCK